MNRELTIEFARVTEIAAIAAYKHLGRGDKNLADDAAVKAMRHMLSLVNIDGEIVIGEGEIDEAPMLYIGEKVGRGTEKVDIAVDPIEGTRMVAMGQLNALATFAAAERGGFLKAPDMYMEKLIVGPEAKGTINLNDTLEENAIRVANKLGKELKDLTVITLSKERHDEVIARMHKLGVKVFAIPDGDVAASILTCMPSSDVDMMYTIGGAPEGVVSAAVIRCLGGDMQGRLIPRTQAKGDTETNRELEVVELQRCAEMECEVNRVYKLEELAKTDNLFFSCTGITKGDLLEGVSVKGDVAETETLVIRGKSGTVRIIKSIHRLNEKEDTIKDIIF